MRACIRWSWLVAALSSAVGCQIVSGLNDLEVKSAQGEDTADDETTGDATTDETSQGDTQPPDSCSIPSGLACAPADNCGCDEGEVCGLTAQKGDLTVGCSSPGKQELGASCKLGDCAPGSLCVDDVCQQVCRFDKDCEADGATCEEVLRPNGEALRGVRYCRVECDVISPRKPTNDAVACATNQTCVLTAQGSVCSNAVGTGEQGDECEQTSDCAAGFTCHDDSCKRWCTVDSPRCGAGLDCVPITGDGPTAAGLGVCEGGCEATIPEGDECLTSPNCGCSDGKTCRVMGDGSRACSPAGNADAQTACTNNSNCAGGLACMAGLCRPYCDPTLPQCNDSSLCVEMEYDGESVGVGACLGLCDPVHPDTDDEVYTPCGEGAECAVGDLEYSYGTSHCMPAPETPGPMLGACDAANPCAAGASCLIGRCFPFCRAPGDCTGATEDALCINVDFGFRGSEDDVLGVCCSPTPVEGSLCAFDLDCGCAEDFSCRIGDTTTGATHCTPVGDVGYQQACERDVDCITGHSCVGGLCSPHCVGSEPCAPNEGECIQVYSGDETPLPVPHAYVCAGRCDPVDVSRNDDEVKPCGTGADCVAGWADVTEGFLRASYCAPDLGDASEGEPCTYDEECALGLGCDFIACPIGSDCLGACVAYCETNDDCSPGADCDVSVGRVGEPGSLVGYCRDVDITPQPD